jgi:hypothetical protein
VLEFISSVVDYVVSTKIIIPKLVEVCRTFVGMWRSKGRE